MGFFDDADDIDVFPTSKGDGGGVGGLASSKPKAALPTAPKNFGKLLLADADDDDDDDFFKDFTVDEDLEADAHAPSAPAPGVSPSTPAAPVLAPAAAPAPVAAATAPISDAADQGMDLLGGDAADANVAVPLETGATGGPVGPPPPQPQLINLHHLLPHQDSQQGPASPPPLSLPAGPTANPQPEQHQQSPRGGAALAQSGAPRAEVDMAEGHDPEPVTAAAPAPEPAAAAAAVNSQLGNGGEGSREAGAEGQAAAGSGAPPFVYTGDALAGTAPAAQSAIVAAFAVATTITAAVAEGSALDEHAAGVAPSQGNAGPMDVDRIEELTMQDAEQLPAAFGSQDAQGSLQDIGQDTTTAAPAAPTAAPASNHPTSTTNVVPGPVTTPQPATSTGTVSGGSDRVQLEQAAPKTVMRAPAASPTAAVSAKLPLQQRQALTSRLPQPTPQPQLQPAPAAYLVAPSQLQHQLQHAGLGLEGRMTTSQASPAAAAPSTAALTPPQSGAGAAASPNSNGLGTPSVAVTATRHPLPAHLGQRRLVSGGLLSGSRPPAAAAAVNSATPVLQTPQSHQPQPQRMQTPSPQQLQPQLQQPAHASALTSSAGGRSGGHIAPTSLTQPPPLSQHSAAANPTGFARPSLSQLAHRTSASTAASAPPAQRLPPAATPAAASSTSAPMVTGPAASAGAAQLPTGPPRLLPISHALENPGAGVGAAVPIPLPVTTAAAVATAPKQAPARPATVLGLRPPVISVAAATADAGPIAAPAPAIGTAIAVLPDNPGSGQVWPPLAPIEAPVPAGNGTVTPTAYRAVAAPTAGVVTTPLATAPQLNFAGSDHTPPSAFSFVSAAPASPVATGPPPAGTPAQNLPPAATAATSAAWAPPAPWPTWPAATGLEVEVSPPPVLALPAPCQSSAAVPEASSNGTVPGKCTASVSLAARLADPIKALEMMILEARAMRDKALELRVQTAVLSNRMVRLDNPMLRDRIAEAKAQAHEELRLYQELLAEFVPGAMVGPPPPLTPSAHVDSGNVEMGTS